MSYRVSQQMMFTNFVNNMNTSLTSLMDLNEQASSQRKVNRPSDAPVAASQILQYRTQITAIKQYDRNVDIATGWLKQADSTLLQVSTVLTRCKELAEQTATGTLSQSNREQVGYEIRQLFEQLIVLSNTEYEGKHIFAGHKTDKPAFVESLALSTNDPAMDQNLVYSIEGATSKTIQVQFLTSGAVGTDQLNYRYSRDMGNTWSTGTLASNANVLDLGGVNVTLSNGTFMRAMLEPDRNDISVYQDGSLNGTWLWVRPTALYQGDFEDTIEVDRFGANDFTAAAQGFFKQDIMVRIDSNGTLGEQITYSYSMDRGASWTTGLQVSNGATPTSASLTVPGGFLELDTAAPGNILASGSQFVIRPQRAQIFLEISPSERLAVNNIGKDVFGGIYKDNACISNCSTAFGVNDPRNMFEVVGKLVGYIETNNQSGIQRALEDLNSASEQVLTAAANVGARENRLEVASNMLVDLKLNKEERLSKIEDADVAELMTQLAQQQLIYESVLKSSSMIMRMSLVNYI
jgi:flagellar hook-associated protein 3 FlgL